MEDESTFHALVSCPKVCVFRFAMREEWIIPAEELFRFTGPDWMLILLDQLGSPKHDQVLFMLWRAWPLRNDMIFGKRKESLRASIAFVGNYWKSFTNVKNSAQVDLSIKDKGVIDNGGYITPIAKAHRNWEPPDQGYIKINVDTRFVESMRFASIGIIARNHLGEVLVSSWDFIGSCTCVDEAEFRAALAGLYIGIAFQSPVILKTDSVTIAFSLAKDSFDRSPFVDLKKEAMSVSNFIKDFKIVKIDRQANRIVHEIVKFCFDSRSDGVLCNSVPSCVAIFGMNDCKNFVISN
ncbi:hypothetical protein CFC21_034609 [Triticum aestivum]|uniref:RNase H type-1 domain-containing protein n=2 Tax=Triticum aestivum TaxID=4565 RepID=A0A3B6ECK7_WHEAT|nr:hypothetical protein CFC21_034609 [Triticum aestivum]